MLKIRAKDLKQFIREALEGPIQIESWVGADSVMKSDNSPYPVDKDASVPIDPKTNEQGFEVHNLPIDDPKWCPRDRKEASIAFSQICEHIPDGQIQFVWSRLKNLVDKALEKTDMTRTPPRIEDIDSSLSPEQTPQQKPKLEA